MKSRRYLKIIAIAFISTSLFHSCHDLDMHYEGGQMNDEQIQNVMEVNPGRISSSVNGMYAILGKPCAFFAGSNRADDFGYPAMAMGQDLNSGDVTNIESGYDWFSVALEWSDRTPTYANPQLRFGIPYRVIYAANDVLSSIADDTENAELIASRGQAKAMRAFSYLSLAPYFQYKYKGNEDKPSVPIIKDDMDPNCNPRATLRELYETILADLDDAIADFEGFSRSNKGVIDQQVAYGLRARAYLYMEEWDKAAADAELAMQGYTPYEITDLTAPGFYDASDRNWIWALLLPSDIIDENGYTTLASWPSQLGSFSGYGYVAYGGIYRSINTLLWKKIPTTDVRKSWWLDENKTSPYLDGLVWSDVARGIDYIGQDIPDANIPDVKEPMQPLANVKFGIQAGIGASYNGGDWCMMRAEEMIFIRAEALAKSGNLAAGKAVLENFVSTYRDPAFTSTATSIEAFSDEVWLQRRIELWGEGFAMADVMRLGKNVVRVIPGEPTNVTEIYQFNIASNDPWMLLRFVQRETTNNQCCEQNVGGTQPEQGDGANLRDGVTD